MTFSVHWAIVTDSTEMYQHVMTSNSLSSQNPSITLSKFLVKWMECLLLWENKSRALNGINQIKIMWKFRLSKKKTVNHLWTWHCIKHMLFIFTLKALHDLSTLHLPFFSMLSTCQLSPLISQWCLPSSPICYVHRRALLPFLPCQPSCTGEAPINISKPTSLFSLKCL